GKGCQRDQHGSHIKTTLPAHLVAILGCVWIDLILASNASRGRVNPDQRCTEASPKPLLAMRVNVGLAQAESASPSQRLAAHTGLGGPGIDREICHIGRGIARPWCCRSARQKARSEGAPAEQEKPQRDGGGHKNRNFIPGLVAAGYNRPPIVRHRKEPLAAVLAVQGNSGGNRRVSLAAARVRGLERGVNSSCPR